MAEYLLYWAGTVRNGRRSGLRSEVRALPTGKERMILLKKRLLTLLLALGMLGGTQTVLAAEPAAQEAVPLPVWSYGMLADGYSLGLFGDEIYTQHSHTVTTEQLDTMTQVVADKLALLEVEQRPAAREGLVIDTTRGGVVNALYQEAAAYAFPGVEEGPEAFMTAVGALAGDGTG